MPTYDYLCEACEEEFQASHKMSDPPVDECPKCGAKGKTRRLMGTGAGLIFKGSGFYITDYKDKGGPKAGSSSKGAEESKGSSEGSSESTPEAKPSSDSGGSSAAKPEKAPSSDKPAAKPEAPAKKG